MNHSIVGSVELFGALYVGAPFGYLQWLSFLAISILGNLVGGLILVTLLRPVEVGRPANAEEQRRDPLERRATAHEPAST